MKKILILLLLYFINCDKTANVVVGSEFDIFLQGDPSTGYKWYLQNISELIKNQILIPRGISKSGIGRYQPSKNHKHGYKGIFIFGFKANKESQKPVTCKFVYKNSSNHVKEEKILKYRVQKF
jgi:predicted secreted protein